MDKQAIITRLLELPNEIEQAENNVICSADILRGQKDRLTEIQDRLIVEGKIDGKNAEARAAQLRVMTEQEQFSVRQAENDLNGDRAYLNKLVNAQANLRAIAGLLKAGE